MLIPHSIRRFGSRPVVVLLHGVVQTRHVWDCIAAVSGRFELRAFDLTDHGEIPPSDTAYDIDDPGDSHFELT